MPLPSCRIAPRTAPSGRRMFASTTRDRAILRVLAADARISNKELAERVGIAQSTCLARVRALREHRRDPRLSTPTSTRAPSATTSRP